MSQSTPADVSPIFNNGTLLMRIVHILNYGFKKSGQPFGNCDHKIHHGLIENGHYVYPFPLLDLARQLHWSGIKKLGLQEAQKSLLETCRQIQPDLLLIAHAKQLENTTLAELRQRHPQMKIAQWYVDALEFPHKIEFLKQRLPYLDAFFATTAGELLEQFKTETCSAYHFPNPVHKDIEHFRSFEQNDHQYDLIFIGSDGGGRDQERVAFLQALQNALPPNIRFGIFGALGQPRIDGPERDEVFLKSKIALNLTRYKPRKYYSSDRIAQIMGNGLLACCQDDFRLQELYGTNCLLTYKTPQDLSHQIAQVIDDDSWRALAQQGWQNSHSNFSSIRVTSRMIETIENL